MKFLIVGIKNNYHVERLREEAQKRGHTVDAALPSWLYIKLIPGKEPKFYLRKLKTPLYEYDLIYIWSISDPKKADWLLFLEYLNQKHKLNLIYSKFLKRDFKLAYLSSLYDYMVEAKHNILFPKTYLFYSHKTAKKIFKKFNPPFILKVSAPKMTSQGKGVFMIENLEQLEEIVKQYEGQAKRFIAREFIPNDGDIRIFTIGYKAIAAMHRIPPEGSFKSNISQGATAKPFDLEKNPHIKEIAERLSKAVELEIAGVDIMIHKFTKRPYVLEINPGPQFRGLEATTGENIAAKIIDFFEKTAKKKILGVF